MSKKINLAVVTGGASAELEVSLKSTEVVISNVNPEKYNVYKVDISKNPWLAFDTSGKSYPIDLNDFSINNATLKFDVAFIAIHGTPAEDGKLQGYFDLVKIPHTANSVLASAITFDKDMTKQLVKDIDVKLAASVLINDKNLFLEQIQEKLSLPFFVKPNKNGSSYGISKVKNFNELKAALDKAFLFDNEVLVEEFIDGRELASGIIEEDGKLIALPITEISPENEFFDYEAKYLGKSKEITPAPISNTIRDRCFSITKEIFTKLKMSGFARIDYFLKGEELYLLEVNTIPGLSAESLLPQQAKAQGYTLEQFFDIIITTALNQKHNLNT